MSKEDLNMENKRTEILPLDMDDLPEFFREKAVKEINYSPETAEKAMRELREIIENDDELKDLRLVDNLLNIYLTCRKFNVDRAYKQMKDGIKFMKKHSDDIFAAPSYDALSIFLTEGMVNPLPKRCQDGCAIIYINMGKWSYEKHPVEDLKQLYNFILLQCIRKPMTQVNGFKMIINLEGSNWESMKICTPYNLHLFVYGIFVISPARFKAVHFVNLFGIGRILWQMTKVFFPTKLKERVELHKSNETLLDFFDKGVLPSHLGGDLKDCDMTWWLKKYLTPEEKAAFEFNIFEKPS